MKGPNCETGQVHRRDRPFALAEGNAKYQILVTSLSIGVGNDEILMPQMCHHGKLTERGKGR